MLKTSMCDYEKFSVVTYPFYFINGQFIHKTNCLQRIKTNNVGRISRKCPEKVRMDDFICKLSKLFERCDCTIVTDNS